MAMAGSAGVVIIIIIIQIRSEHRQDGAVCSRGDKHIFCCVCLLCLSVEYPWMYPIALTHHHHHTTTVNLDTQEQDHSLIAWYTSPSPRSMRLLFPSPTVTGSGTGFPPSSMPVPSSSSVLHDVESAALAWPDPASSCRRAAALRSCVTLRRRRVWSAFWGRCTAVSVLEDGTSVYELGVSGCV